jgi:thiamine-monophosphate kinase
MTRGDSPETVLTPAAASERGEFALLRRLQARLGAPGAAPGIGFGDDMAALAPAAPGWLWTVDMVMDGVDFDSRVHDWATIGRKAMAVNLSDCAAMGVAPVSALCAVALHNGLTLADAETLILAADACGREFNCPVVGGDTNSWDAPTAISITVAGQVPPGGAPVPRSGARPRDSIWVSGPLGGSLLGRHLTFTPRVALGLELARTLRPHAMIDISDGLAVDLARILTASGGLGAVLSAAALDQVVHADAFEMAARDGRSPRAHALHDGEDFELLMVLPANTDPAAAQALGLHALGEVVADAGLWLTEAGGARTEIPPLGWEHFK